MRAIHNEQEGDGDDHDDTPTGRAARVFGGVDTHKDVHVAAALDELGRLLGTGSFPTTAAGYRQLWRWLRTGATSSPSGSRGPGRGVPAWPVISPPQGVDVREVMRPNRQHRRRYGKSDEADAIGAARAVLAGEALGTPKSGTGQVEAIRLLRVARRSAMKARTQAGNQIHAVVDTAPEQLADASSADPPTAIVAETALFRRRHAPTRRSRPPGSTMRTLARRWEYLDDELDRPRRPARRTHRQHRPDAAGDQRCRRPGGHRRARRRRRQPRTAALISVVRRAVRRLTDRRILRPSATPSAQPLRRPSRQLGAPP